MHKPQVDLTLASLKDELRQAQEQEMKRQNENDSKLRAVAQHMDYDQFRQMVLGANLKCAKSGEINNIKPSTGERRLNGLYREVGDEPVQVEIASEEEISTLTVFRRRWKGADRWNVLKLAAPHFSAIFAKGIECDTVADLVTLAHKGLISHEYTCAPEDWAPLWNALTQLSGFAQGLKMLSRREREAYEQVTQLLQ